MSQPILTNWSNHIDRNFIFNVLSVPVVRNSSGIYASWVGILRIHNCVILFCLVSWLHVGFLCDIELGTCLVDVFVPNYSSFNIDIEPFAARRKIGSNFMRNREIVSLTGNWSSKSSAERINNGREPAICFQGSFEALSHERARIIGKQTKLLLRGHRVITRSKELRSNFAFVHRFVKTACR